MIINDWENVIRLSKKEWNTILSKKKLTYPDFIDFRKIRDTHFPNYNTFNDGTQVKWFAIRHIPIHKECPHVLNIKYDFEDDNFQSLDMTTVTNRSVRKPLKNNRSKVS